MLSVRIPLVIGGCGLWILRNQHQPPSGVSLTGVRCVTQSLESVACQLGWALLVRIIHAHTDPNKSARSGVSPSTHDIDLGCGERPGARPTTFWSTAFLHAKNADLRSLNGASLGGAWASSSTKLRASAFLRPPVSSARTTTQHRSAATSSEYLSSLSRRSWVRRAPSTAATCRRGVPQEVNALLRVMSTASYAPWRMGNPAATSTFRSSLGSTWTFISRNLTLRLTVAPASRQTRAKMICGNRSPLQPARPRTRRSVPAFFPNKSFWPPHSNVASVRRRGRRRRSKPRCGRGKAAPGIRAQS